LSKERRRRPRGGKNNKPKGDRGGSGGQAEKEDVAGRECKANCDDTCLNCNRAGHWAKDCPFQTRAWWRDERLDAE